MATDDEKRDGPQDSWPEIDAVDLPDLAADFALPLDDETAARDADDQVPDGPVIPAADAGPGEVASAGDSDIDAWLNDFDNEPRPALSVFQEDEIGAFADEAEHALLDPSSVEIGTGHSGVPSPSSLEGGSDPFADEGSRLDSAELPDFSLFAEAGSGPAADFERNPDNQPDEAIDSIFTFEEVVDPTTAQAPVAGERTTGAAVVLPDATPDGTRPRKKSGRGGLIGILAGGLLAIPITLGILLWGFGRDPFGVANLVPDSLAFLVPGSLRPAGFGPPIAVTAAEPLRQLAGPAASALALTADSTAEPDADPDATGTLPDASDEAVVAGEPAGEPPAALAAADTAFDDVVTPEPELRTDAPMIEPDPAALLAVLESRDAGPSLEPPPPVVVEPEPEPLDVSGLVTAAADAVAATEAVVSNTESAAPSPRQLVVWYRSLAAYAESLARLEREAEESGRTLDGAAASVADVAYGIGSRPELHAPLARLSRDWIGFARRPSDGVVVPARFLAARPVGPFWRSEVRISDTEGRPDLDLVVVTRAEPAVAADEIVVITGLTLDDGVIWAADVRAAAEAGGSGP